MNSDTPGAEMDVEGLTQKLEVADATLNDSFLAVVSERAGVPFARAIVTLKAKSQEAAVALRQQAEEIARLKGKIERFIRDEEAGGDALEQPTE